MADDRNHGTSVPRGSQTKVATDGEKRTTLSLSLTVSDKKALKLMAAERETTIAAIVHEWVAEHIEEMKE